MAFAVLAASAIVLASPAPVRAEDDALSRARAALRSVLEKRADLQALFDAATWLPARSERTAGISSLEDWALKYGHKEHAELSWFGTDAARTLLSSGPRALAVRAGADLPTKSSGATFDFAKLESKTVFVADYDSRRVLLEKDADVPRADAAVAKLAAAATALESGTSVVASVTMQSGDETGGTRLPVAVGTVLTVQDLLFAMLTDSANNATLALARTSAGNVAAFTERMNATVRSWGLTATSFVDPTGVQAGSTTTAREAAAVLIEAMAREEIRRPLSVSRRPVAGVTVSNPNVLLTDPDNGLYVYGGKLGYLRATGWHMVVDMRDLVKQKRLVIALSGASTKDALFRDAETVARWVWTSHEWRAPSETDSGAQGGESFGRPIAQSPAPSLLAARANLKAVYGKRADLQSLFDATSWLPVRSTRTSGLANLEDWAAKYGRHEHDALWWYGTRQARQILSGGDATVASAPRALTERDGALAPKPLSVTPFDPSNVTADAYIAVDVPTRKILLARNADEARPLASVTKVMTAVVALENGTPFDSRQSITSADEIGGARLRVPVGTQMTFRDLMYSMLVGSANNAAHAAARVSDTNVQAFVSKMNAKAGAFGLANTEFADPSGLDVRNVSTAREIAALLFEALEHYEIRKMCSTAEYEFLATDGPHVIKNTNALLTDNANGLTVLGGKTGYLIESEWNLAVRMMDARQKQIVVVVLGSDTHAQLFRDARTIADWVWNNYRWN